jgi:hypothetical protein
VDAATRQASIYSCENVSGDLVSTKTVAESHLVDAVASWFTAVDFGAGATQHFSASFTENWSSHCASPWTHVAPIGASIPEQGWKTHVSATAATAHQALAVVSAIAVDLGVPFKHLSTLADFLAFNSKYADRASGGKFIALYPRDEAQLAELLTHLTTALAGFPGPFILSDAQHGDAPVFVRYGAFRELWSTVHGHDVLCIRDPDGNPVEDRREPQFSVPDFVDVPDFLEAVVRTRLHPEDDSLDVLLDGRTVEHVMHFTNGGGVYLLIDAHGRRVIMKEGRPDAGVDPRGVDASRRVRHEHANLVALADTGVTPLPHGFRSAGGHGFLFEEYVDGDSLHSWIAQHYPFSYAASVNEYERDALIVVTALVDAVERVHARGFAVMDLQPSNVIVRADLTVRLIDLESCCPLTAVRADTYIGTPGFVPRVEHTPLQRDSYALMQLALDTFLPLTALSAVSDTVIDRSAEIITARFSGAVVTLLDELRAAGESVRDDAGLVSCAAIPGTPAEAAVLLAAGLRRARRTADTFPYPLDSGGALHPSTAYSVGLQDGLAGIMFGARDDLLETANCASLAASVQEIPTPRRGLFTGLTGAALLLQRRDPSNDYRALIGKARPADPWNVSLRSGSAGELLAAVLLARDSQQRDVALMDALETVRTAVRNPAADIVSPGNGTDRPLGLLDGWSGVAYALATAADHLDDDGLFDEARDALELDLPNLVRASDGSLQADDGQRMMPYLADGSAGIGIALSAIPVEHRRIGDDEILHGIAMACRARVCVSAGLFHGRAGLVLALAALDIDDIDGVTVADVVSEQLELLAPHLFLAADDGSLFVAADDNTRLGTGFAEGAAGVAYMFRLLAGDAVLPGPRAIRERISARCPPTD